VKPSGRTNNIKPLTRFELRAFLFWVVHGLGSTKEALVEKSHKTFNTPKA